MADYAPLDLGPLCNVGVNFYRQDAELALGRQQFWGLPFVIGDKKGKAKRCFIGFGGKGGASKPITVPVNKAAHHLIFAHVLLESKIEQGEPIGHVAATYVVRFADGEEVALPIRERLEVSAFPPIWGQLPMLAVMSAIPDVIRPRDEGPYARAGWRQTEVSVKRMNGVPYQYYLWAWPSPDPKRKIESIRIEPADRKFLVAAITLGHKAEEPFARQARREVLLTLNDAADADRPFDLDVEVDRGMATYVFPVSTRSPDEFVDDPVKGWGEAANESSSPTFVEISAIDSATVKVKQNDKTIAKANWGKLQKKEKIDTPRVNFQVVDRGKNWVHTTVVDDDTDKPIPCRVHFRSSEGVPYQPHGFHNYVNSNQDTWHIDVGGDMRLGQITYAYIDGKCQGWLPRGEVVVDVGRGFEYEPLRTKVRIEPGQRELTLRLKRMTNMNDRRWFSGDSHVHFLGTQGAHHEAQGEDLNVVNLLASQWGHLFTNAEDFIGRPTVSDDGNTIVYCSQENRQHMLGHLILWGLKEPVMPWCSGGSDEAELAGTLEMTMSHWADACHAQGGTVVIPHLPNPNAEPAALIATGRADAIEMLVQGPYQHLEYYRYLNCGYRLPLVGGTDKMTSDVPVGVYRTYAHLPADQPFDYANWCQAVRAGRTFLSGGPLIFFTVDGAQVGDTVRLPGDGGTVEVEAVVESIFPVHTLQIVQAGNVVASTEETDGARRLHVKAKLKIDDHTWLAARCGGPDYGVVPHHDGWGRGRFAHTSPIYVAVGEDWWMFDRDAAQYMLTLIDGTVEHIRQRTHQHPPGTATHHHGRDDHAKYLEEPFDQARAAIHQRMHQFNIPH